MSTEDSSSLIKAQFRELDKNGDGTLNYKEFKALFKRIDPNMSYKDMLALFRAVDKDGSGWIDFEEFVDYVCGSTGTDAGGGGHACRSSDSGNPKFQALLPHPRCGCRIPEAELRGITTEQIGLVIEYCTLHCEADSWTFGGGPKQGEPLALPDVSLYDICKYVIEPATAPRRCSYVEMVADEPQPPVWFCSHWWGEPHFDLLNCLNQHRKDRGLVSESPYWICAYANNQHELSKYVTSDPNKSAFRLAMDQAVGVVSVVDVGAVCFSRIWCCYEVFVCLESTQCLMYDMYTAHEHLHSFTDKRGRPVGAPCKRSAVGISDGFAACDNGWADYKSNREMHFPDSLLQRALDLRLEVAQASVDSDRLHILNTIAGSLDLDAQPPLEHVSYEQLNSTLHGRVAASALRRGVDAGGELFERYLLALSGSRLRELSVDFGGSVRFTNEVLALVVEALEPDALEVLVLSRCEQISALPEGIVGFKKLRILNLYHCKSLRSLPKGLAKLPSLRKLNVVGSRFTSPMPPFPEAVQIETDL